MMDGRLLIGPQQRTVIGVIGNHRSRLFRFLHRVEGGASGRFVRQGQGTAVEDLRILHDIQIHFLPVKLGIRSRLSGKGKASLPVIQGHESQRGEKVGIHHHTRGIDSRRIQGILEKLSVHVVSHFSDKSRLGTQICQSRQHIGRSSSRILLKQRHPRLRFSAGCKINQYLS